MIYVIKFCHKVLYIKKNKTKNKTHTNNDNKKIKSKNRLIVRAVWFLIFEICLNIALLNSRLDK